MEEKIGWGAVNRLVRQSGATDPENVKSYLRHCLDEADAQRFLLALRANQPHLFKSLRGRLTTQKGSKR